MTNSNIKNYEDRQQWFVDRVGKVLWRTKSSCNCPVCDGVYKDGITVHDVDHACYLNDCSGEFPLTYFDTQKERDEFENAHLKKIHSLEDELGSAYERMNHISADAESELKDVYLKIEMVKEYCRDVGNVYTERILELIK